MPIRFEPADHTYWIGGRQLAAVTATIKRLVPPFDQEQISRRVAAREGVSQKEILERWRRAGNAGRERGTRVHSYVEDVLNGTHDEILAGVNERIPEMNAFDAAWAAMGAKLGAVVSRQEFVVGDSDLGIAGRVDVLLSVRADGGRTECVFDWKTGRFERTNRFENLLPPFDDLPNCEHAKYSLQTSLYRVLLERMNPGRQYGNAYLVHLSESGSYFVHRATDYRERLVNWLRRK